MKNKVVFFFNYLDDRYDKRVREFIENGYEVEVYAFMQLNDTLDKYKGYIIHPQKYYAELPSYATRFKDYIPTFRKIVKQYDPDTTLFYFFSINTALTSLFCGNIKFIYEESDMLFDRVKNEVFQGIIKRLNYKIIKKSAQTVFTSEGFATYYFGNSIPDNITIIPNKVSPICKNLPKYERKATNFNNLRFGFVGAVRYSALYNFAKNLVTLFPQHEFHFYGSVKDFSEEQVKSLENAGKVSFHGRFKAPDDFPSIYGNIDFVVATYDTKELNPKYAEPNKLYESMFFGVPIIVSGNSFLADKVKKIGNGFDIDPYDLEDIRRKVGSVSEKTYNQYLNVINSIDKEELVNNNAGFFSTIEKIVNQ